MMKLNQSGLTLVETMIAVAIAVIAFTAISTGVVNLKKISSQSQVRSTEGKQVLQIIENIRTSVENQQISFASDSQSREQSLNPASLPMGWSPKAAAPVASCATCPGRYGYVIQPYPGMRGLYLVTVRFTFNTWDVPYKDYQFLASVR